MFRGFQDYIQADAHCVYDALFRGDARIDKTDKPPDEVACWSRRQRVSRPMLDVFFAWADGVFERVRGVRGPVATALSYAIRQRDALRRFLDDGRLRMENNASERALRPIAVGRNAWLFFGSGDHAQAAANI